MLYYYYSDEFQQNENITRPKIINKSLIYVNYGSFFFMYVGIYMDIRVKEHESKFRNHRAESQCQENVRDTDHIVEAIVA